MEETNQPVVTTAKQPNPYLIPGSIVIAGAIIAAAVFLSNSAPVPVAAVAQPGQPLVAEDTTSAVREITSADHIKGDINAPIKIVEYSDFECPFCKNFHDTMNEIMTKYGESGEVAWVFRQSPIDQLHPVKARAVAVATECAAELGGNNAFWQFADRYMELTLTNNRTDVEVVIPQIVKEIGLNQTNFQECFVSGRHDAKIAADIANSQETGGGGTPWSILIGPDGKTYPINGAQPIGVVEQLINIAKNGS